MKQKKSKIIVFIGHFLPGYKNGGPTRTIKNLVDAFSDYCDFGIVCNYCDLGETQPYKGIRVDQWNHYLSKYNIYYCDIKNLKTKKIIALCQGFDAVYCCGCYDPYAIRLCQSAKKGLVPKVFVAPMGNFSPNALRIKKAKKKIFFTLAKIFGLFKKITWCFTSSNEYQDGVNVLKNKRLKYIIASDLPRCADEQEFRKLNERPNPLKIIFLSRICKMKNLKQAIEIVAEANCECIFDIYGFIEDEGYFNVCQAEMQKLPSKVRWAYCGSVDSEKVSEVFKKYDVFVFPTLGENFGHVILESIQSGCVPIISTNTSWELEKYNTGYCIPLDNQRRFAIAINKLNDDRELLVTLANNCIAFSQKYAKEAVENSGYWDLLK